MKIQVEFKEVKEQKFQNLNVTQKKEKLLVFYNVTDFFFDDGYLTIVYDNTDETDTVDCVKRFGTID